MNLKKNALTFIGSFLACLSAVCGNNELPESIRILQPPIIPTATPTKRSIENMEENPANFLKDLLEILELSTTVDGNVPFIIPVEEEDSEHLSGNKRKQIEPKIKQENPSTDFNAEGMDPNRNSNNNNNNSNNNQKYNENLNMPPQGNVNVPFGIYDNPKTEFVFDIIPKIKKEGSSIKKDQK